MSDGQRGVPEVGQNHAYERVRVYTYAWAVHVLRSSAYAYGRGAVPTPFDHASRNTILCIIIDSNITIH